MRNGSLAPASGQPVYKTVRTSRLYEQIVQQIEESILKGILKPGDQLPAERELAQRLSPTVLPRSFDNRSIW
jgi:DNA-binding transcriptional regulator YhcF (GntR family)